jgi:AcrR family transcriptional regulator
MKMGARQKPRAYRQGVRADAAEATARRIIDAFIARLMRQWFDETTLDQVAGDADVTVQTVVRRFGGKEGLLAAAIETFGKGVHASRGMNPQGLDGLARGLLEDYEKTGDAIVRLLALEPRYPAALTPALEVGRRGHREWVAGALEERLGRIDAARRRQVLDALVIATDVYTWKLLRRDMGRSIAATQATIARMVRAILDDNANTQGEEQ